MTWGATTGQILALREHLVATKVTCVVIESTSDYWKTFYYLLDDALDVVLVNARAVRNLPGRKTDVAVGGGAGGSGHARTGEGVVRAAGAGAGIAGSDPDPDPDPDPRSPVNVLVGPQRLKKLLDDGNTDPLAHNSEIEVGRPSTVTSRNTPTHIPMS
jgi:hypothetical protein